MLAAAAGAAAGCASRRSGVAPPNPYLPMRMVNVAEDRVIRGIVGLRPFRPSGFVVRAAKLDEKTVVHNYGHGGAGITLSWGTSQLAMEEAAATGARQCAVLGCGVVGLSTARLAQLRGMAVTIYAKAMPPDTTSNVAGGLWEPVSLYDGPSVTPGFRRQFAEASRIAFRRYQSMAGDLYGVRWMPLYSLSLDHDHEPPSADDPASEVEPLYPESRNLKRGEHGFNVPHVHRRMTMLIEPAIYLNALIRDFLTAGGKIVIREFASLREVAALAEPLIFNCTGLGAGALFGDAEIMPIRGQLVFLLPQPEVNYCTIGPTGIYMFPRHDGILLGGSFERGNASLTPDPATATRILRNSRTIFGGA
jgi:D-amino-acid oxidase